VQRVVSVNSGLVVHDTLDGEVLAIRNDTGTYFSMVGTAADVWACILAGLDVVEAGAVLSARYEIAAADAAAAVDSFVAELLEHQLVVERAAEPVAAAPAPLVSRVAWQVPVLEQFTDMQDLLLFDTIHEVQPEGWPNVSGPQG